MSPSARFPLMEKRLLCWFSAAQKPIDKNVVKEQAISILKEEYTKVANFRASDVWIRDFIRRWKLNVDDVAGLCSTNTKRKSAAVTPNGTLTPPLTPEIDENSSESMTNVSNADEAVTVAHIDEPGPSQQAKGETAVEPALQPATEGEASIGEHSTGSNGTQLDTNGLDDQDLAAIDAIWPMIEPLVGFCLEEQAAFDSVAGALDYLANDNVASAQVGIYK